MRIGRWTGSLAMSLVAACGPGDAPIPGPASGRPPSAGTGGSVGADGGPRKALPVGVFNEELVESEPAPLPIAGGTLAIIAQGSKAALADPDHDQVVVIDLGSLEIAKVIPLAPGDDPGRLIEDGAGRLHVALRAGRGVAVLDPVSGEALRRLPVCLLPRGLAYEYASDSIHVACAGGELVTYSASSGERLRKLRLERDLRDVVIDGDRLLVSRFRAAEMVVVERDGKVSQTLSPPTVPSPALPGIMKPSVAWRAVAAPGGGALMVHQLFSTGAIGTEPGGYGQGCRRILTTAVSLLRVNDSGWMVDGIPTVLPVDIATTLDGSRVAVPGAGRASTSIIGTLPYAVFNPPPGQRHTLSQCGAGFVSPPFVDGAPVPVGRVVAVAFDPAGRFAIQTREPGEFFLGVRSVTLPGRSRKHTGHELFHLGTVGGIACASCHPEGHDDGQVWTFSALGPRRTQSLAGGILGTEPFHWAGDMRDFDMLVKEVFAHRMSGPTTEPKHGTSLMKWVDTIPAREAPEVVDPAAVQRGQALFQDTAIGCANCHSGPRLTNNTTTSVGTGGSFQVPSLRGLAWRAPYMHDGCATTLGGRFVAASGSPLEVCGGGDSHGQTSGLTAAQRADLITYMDTL